MPDLQYIRNEGDRIIIATLQLELGKGAVSQVGFTSEQLNNGEVINLKNKGFISLVGKDTPPKINKPKVQTKPNTVKTGDSWQHISELPGGSFVGGDVQPEADKLLKDIQGSLDKLKALFESIPNNDNGGVSEEGTGQISRDAYPDAPLYPPKGYQPSKETQEFLKLQFKDKLRTILACSDIGMLREIIMFETVINVKKKAQERAIIVERGLK